MQLLKVWRPLKATRRWAYPRFQAGSSPLESISFTVLPFLSLRQPCSQIFRPIAHCELFRYNISRRYTSQVSFRDPNRPDLYYYLVQPPTPLSASQVAYALSFVDVAPSRADSATLIGWLPAHTTDSPETQKSSRQKSTGLKDFVANSKFIALLHDTVKSALKERLDPIWENGALQLQEGWMHIHDQRNVPALGRIGDPDDIIGSVLVRNSKIDHATYQPMPSYRVCTADGILQLTPGLAGHLLQAINAIVKDESA